MRQLNYKHLHYFWVVAREGGIANASRSLYLTPQTISGQITALEQQVGEKLFVRKGRRLEMTEVGRMVYQYADEMFRLGTELKDALSGRLPGGVQTFTVGISDAVPKLLAYRLLEPALRGEQSFRVVCHEGRFDDLLGRLAIHRLDLVIADAPVPPGMHLKVYNHALGESGMSFLATKKLAQRMPGKFPKSLDGAPMLLPGVHAGMRRLLQQWLEQHGVQPAIAAECDDSALLKVFGEAGIGVFAVPTAIEREVVQQHDVQVIGRTDEIREQYYALSAERKIKHPAVLAISDAARRRLSA
jgi:LysR family transcriptional regulator, transcriptional activator of nhaA